MPADGPRFLSAADVALILNITVRQVRSLLKSGDLRGIQFPRGIWRIEAVELEAYIQRLYERTEAAVAEQDDVTSR